MDFHDPASPNPNRNLLKGDYKMTDATRAKPSEVKAFFEADGGRKVGAREIMALKKINGVPTKGVTYETAYDDIAAGIGDGTLTY